MLVAFSQEEDKHTWGSIGLDNFCEAEFLILELMNIDLQCLLRLVLCVVCQSEITIKELDNFQIVKI